MPWHSITLNLQNCLGLEFFNPNIAGEMAQLVMKNQHHYVPLTNGGSNQAEILEPIFFDGDALTENVPEMSSGCLKMVIPELTISKALIQYTQIGKPRLNYMK